MLQVEVYLASHPGVAPNLHLIAAILLFLASNLHLLAAICIFGLFGLLIISLHRLAIVDHRNESAYGLCLMREQGEKCSGKSQR
ncbi:hypothetical protein NC652_041622 [Populus alba x Populus x berolinensis]|nr:hypothetical protein NC652_041622 [Populus alba x Populus x berolinensis]